MHLLEALCTTPGVPGREHRVRELIQQHAGELFDDLHTDAMGSLHAVRHPRPSSKSRRAAGSPKRIMVAAHMDQIGFLVKHIDDKGFLRLNAVGGFDLRNLFARLVTVCPDLEDPAKDLIGVMNPSGKPIHIADDADKKKVPEMHEFIVDLGLPGDEVKKKVKVGDMVVLRASFERVGRTIVSQCLDNRIACWVALRAIEKLKQHACEIHVVFTVQEEVGLRGARTAAFAVKPDIGIALDTTLCVDIPGVPDDMAVTRQGQGVGLNCMDGYAISDYQLIAQFEAIAAKKQIKTQRTVLPRGGTDAGTMQMAREGVPTIALVCGTRYIHTVTEMIHEDDLAATRDLLAAFLAEAK